MVHAPALQSLQFTRNIQLLAKDRRDHPSQSSIKYLHYFKCKAILKGDKRKAPKLNATFDHLHACTDVSWLRNVLDSISTWRCCVVFKVGVEFARFKNEKKLLGVAMCLLVTSAWPEHGFHTGTTDLGYLVIFIYVAIEFC